MSHVIWAPGMTLDEGKDLIVLACLEHCGGNKTQAARALGVSVRVLRDWVRERKILGAYRIKRGKNE